MRGEPHGGFIKHKESRPPHDGPPDVQHLLLPPAQRACPLGFSFFQDREEIIDPFQVFLDFSFLFPVNERSHQKIIEHGESREGVSALGNVSDPYRYDLMRIEIGHILFLEENSSLGGLENSGDGEKKGRLSCSIGTYVGANISPLDFR